MSNLQPRQAACKGRVAACTELPSLKACEERLDDGSCHSNNVEDVVRGTIVRWCEEYVISMHAIDRTTARIEAYVVWMLQTCYRSVLRQG